MPDDTGGYSRFQVIMDACEEYPHKYELRHTGMICSLARIGSMLYIDIRNMFHILEELYGPGVPYEIVDLLRRILYVESLEIRPGVSGEMISTEFIDRKTFEKIESWLQTRKEEYETGGDLFSVTPVSTSPSVLGDDCADEIDDDIGSMFPFCESWKIPEIFRNAKSGYSKSEGEGDERLFSRISRPRGKKVPEAREKGDGFGQERPFVCEFPGCKRAFKRHEHLKRHEKMHTGERPFKCLFPGCMKSFSRSDNLNSHYKTHNMRGGKDFFATSSNYERTYDETYDIRRYGKY